MSSGPFQLLTLGRVDLRSADGSLSSVLAQPKRLGLLVYLASARHPAMHQRDEVIAMLWPESDHEHARRALRQSLYFLRSRLGAGTIRTIGDERISLDPQRIVCDGAQFEKAIAEGRPEQALDIYHGGFLAGFHIDDAPEFERWIAAERDRLARVAISAAWQLADSHARKMQFEQAGQYAEWALRVSPADEAGTRRAMELLARSGDRAGGLRLYEELCARLRDEYELEPAPETSALALDLRTRGAEAPSAATAPAPARRIELSAPRLASPVSRRAARWHRLAYAGVALSLLATLAYRIGFPADSLDTPDPARVFVAPFRVSAPDSGWAAMGEGMVHMIGSMLTSSAAARALDSRASVSAWRKATGETGRDLTVEEARALARSLGAGRLLLGEILVTPVATAVTGRLIAVDDGRVLAERREFGAADEATLVLRLIGRLFADARGEDPLRVLDLSASPEAVAAYHRGMNAYARSEHDSAVMHLGRALEIDSTFAAAALWRAMAQNLSMPRPNQGNPVYQAWRLRDRLTARDRALVAGFFPIGPNYPETSSTAELISAQKTAAVANPDRPEAWWQLGAYLLYFGPLASVPHAHAQSIASLDSALALDPSFGPALQFRLMAAIDSRDTAAMRSLASRYFATKPPDANAYVYRWVIAYVTGDRDSIERVERGIDSVPLHSLAFMVSQGTVRDLPLDAVVAELERRTRTLTAPDAVRAARSLAMLIALIEGRATDADRILEPLVAEGDADAAMLMTEWHIAERRLPIATPARLLLEAVADTASDPQARANAVCFAELGRTFAGDTSRTRVSVRELRELVSSMDAAPFPRVGRHQVCPLLLEAAIEQAGRRSAGPMPALERLETRMRDGTGYDLPGALANVMLARWHRASGRTDLALAAARRRVTGFQNRHFSVVEPARQREEASLLDHRD